MAVDATILVFLILYAVLLLAGGAAAARSADQLGDMPDTVVALAEKLGLPAKKLRRGQWSIEGHLNGRQVQVTVRLMGGLYIVQTEVALNLPPKARVRPESAFQGNDPELGEPGFDSLMDLRGPEDWLSAAFSAEARALMKLLQGGESYSLQAKQLRATTSVTIEGLASAAADVGSAARLGELLSISRADLPARLLANAQDDPVERVRLLAGLRLLTMHPGSEAARAFARDLPAPELAPFAALATDVPAEPLLIPLLSKNNDTFSDAAIAALHRWGTVAAVPALRDAARGSQRDPAEAAIAAIQARIGPVEAGRLAVAADPQAEGALSLQQEGGLAFAPPTKKDPA